MRPLSFLERKFQAGNRGREVVGDSGFRGCQAWNALFLLGTETSVRTEVAMLARLGLEHSLGNSFRGLFHRNTSREQIRLRTIGYDRYVFFQIMKDESPDLVFPFLPGGDGVKRQLQTFIRRLLIAGFARLVVNDRDRSV